MMLKNYLKKTFSDVFSFLFLLTALICIYFFEIRVVIPEVHQNNWHIYLHSVLGTYIFANIVGNLYKVMSINTSSQGIILPSLLKPLWQFCSTCEANAPPRSFHCHKCGSCILKRDHHCVFACCCIGLKNFRYYLMFLLYLALGALYASVLNMFFIWGHLGGFSTFSFTAHFIPFIFWLLGYLDVISAFYAFMSVLCISGFLFVTNLFILHSSQMLKNQTSYEKVQGIVDYDLGWKQNLVESLGTRWHLVWLFPTVTSILPSDGLSFMLQAEFQNSLPKVK